ncbi:hypothetical protein RYZ26_01140 [Terasakiella sp. A23]|uniref:hypothetical protein n=1 Tax=Terasakiella sp. FCG-A23 TaxID=3080561 RepID=UPI0029559CF3|nr:hypothetical protein [Terasakiella sp. A23]MDV7338180.1 hypothetical protein [Terasakiella sp. A23]
MMMRKFIMIMLIAAFTASLGACGRKNEPVAPEDVDPKYPRTYPAPTKAPTLMK